MLNLPEQEFPFGDEQTVADVTEEAVPFSIPHPLSMPLSKLVY